MSSDARLDLRICALVPGVMGSTMVRYAADARAFADLAAVVASASGEPAAAHRDVAASSSGHWLKVTGLAEFSARNQAIGVC